MTCLAIHIEVGNPFLYDNIPLHICTCIYSMTLLNAIPNMANINVPTKSITSSLANNPLAVMVKKLLMSLVNDSFMSMANNSLLLKVGWHQIGSQDAEFLLVIKKNGHRSEILDITTCCKIVHEEKQWHAPCTIILLQQILVCVCRISWIS